MRFLLLLSRLFPLVYLLLVILSPYCIFTTLSQAATLSPPKLSCLILLWESNRLWNINSINFPSYHIQTHLSTNYQPTIFPYIYSVFFLLCLKLDAPPHLQDSSIYVNNLILHCSIWDPAWLMIPPLCWTLQLSSHHIKDIYSFPFKYIFFAIYSPQSI